MRYFKATERDEAPVYFRTEDGETTMVLCEDGTWASSVTMQTLTYAYDDDGCDLVEITRGESPKC
jgi:hypothetical protein